MANVKNSKTLIINARFSKSQEKALLDLFLGTALGAGLPTSSTGLKTGQLWSNSGVVTIAA